MVLVARMKNGGAVGVRKPGPIFVEERSRNAEVACGAHLQDGGCSGGHDVEHRVLIGAHGGAAPERRELVRVPRVLERLHVDRGPCVAKVVRVADLDVFVPIVRSRGLSVVLVVSPPRDAILPDDDHAVLRGDSGDGAEA